MRRLLFAAAGIAALTAAGVAVAQDRGHGPFRYDSNNDGVLTRQEFDTGHAAQFTEMDANHDGALARGEGRGHRGEGGHRRMGHRGGGHLRGADANNDGNVTREEFLARPTAMFARLDANSDGVIQASERPQPRRRHAEGESRPARVNPDADNNGSISQAEFAAMGARRFDRMDANDDGRVTREEAQAGHGRHRQPTQQ